MVRAFSFHAKGDTSFSVPLGIIALFACVTFLVALCAKHARKISERYKPETSDPKVTPFHSKNNKKKNYEGHEEAGKPKSSKHQDKIEEGGLWQKAILMGEKCQPPEFSGVIYYDSHGNRVSELPRTPHRTPYRGSTLSDFISVRV